MEGSGSGPPAAARRDHDVRRTGVPGEDRDDCGRVEYGAMKTGCDCYRFQSRMGTMAKMVPVASVNRKPSGSRPEWRLATSAARVFAAAIAWSLVAKTQISFSTGTAPLSQSIENKAAPPGMNWTIVANKRDRGVMDDHAARVSELAVIRCAGLASVLVAVFVFPTVTHHIQSNLGIRIGLAVTEAAV
jgi:hypothetical protein